MTDLNNLSSKIARKAARAILAAAHAQPSGFVWVRSGVNLSFQTLFAHLPPTQPSDPGEREEQEITAVLDLLIQTGCDWEDWAALHDVQCAAEKPLRQRFRPDWPIACNACRQLSADGWLILEQPLRFLCRPCNERTRE